jgi:ABC-type arginine transport system permease subunit
VEIVVVATLWSMFFCVLIFPMLGMPAYMRRAVTTLMTAEFVAILVWLFGSEECVERPCAPLAEAGRTAAAVDVPLLSLGVVALAIIRGVRHHQRLNR